MNSGSSFVIEEQNEYFHYGSFEIPDSKLHQQSAVGFFCHAVQYMCLMRDGFGSPPRARSGRNSGNQNVLFQFTYFKMRESVEREEGKEGREGGDVNGTFSLQIARFISYLQRMK